MPKFTALLNILCLLPLFSDAQTWIPDPSFNGCGSKVISTALASEYISASTLAANGKIITAGKFSVIQQYESTGLPDILFGENGIAFLYGLETILSTDNYVVKHESLVPVDVKTQSDNSIIVLGTYGYTLETDPILEYLQHYFITKLNPDGTIDTSFGTKGVRYISYTQIDDAVGLLILPDDKILILGIGHPGSGKTTTLTQLTSDGNLDYTFSSDGKNSLLYNTNIYATDFAVNDAGEIFVSAYGYTLTAIQMYITKFFQDGSLDSLFGENGVLKDSVNMLTYGMKICVDEMNILVAGATLNSEETEFDVFIKKYDINGTTDSDFGEDGVFLFDAGYYYDFPSEMLTDDDGNIFVSVHTTYGNTDFKLIYVEPHGTINLSFGVNGLLETDFNGGGDKCNDMELQTDGKFVLAGSADFGLNQDYSICRISTDGSLDESFAHNGKSHINLFQEPDYCKSISLGSDGSVFMGGESDDIYDILKLTPAGLPDSSFSDDGIFRNYVYNSEIKDIKINKSGDVICLGNKADEGYGSETWDLYNGTINLMKVTPYGQLDNLFGNEGMTEFNASYTYDANEFASEFEILRNQKIIVTGYNETYDYVYPGWMVNNKTKFLTFRMNENGTIDSSFGNNGEVVTQFSLFDQNISNSLKVQRDGKIIIAGYSVDETSATPFKYPVAIRYNQNGTLDSSFAANGIFFSDIYNYGGGLMAMVLQEDQKILLAGYYGFQPANKILLIRLNPDGSPDLTFHENGFATFEMQELMTVTGIETDQKGRILICGSIHLSAYDFYTMRFNSDGTIDNTFGLNGIITTSLTSGNDMAYDIRVDGNDCYVAGTASESASADFAVVKYIESNEIIEIGDANHFFVFPNPVSDNYLTIKYNLANSDLLSINLFNESGVLVQPFFESEYRAQGEHTETFNIQSNLAAANYFIGIKTGSSQSTFQIIKM